MNLSTIAQSTKGEGGFELPAPGTYKGYIESAEVKVGTTTGNKYLSLRISLSDADGKKYGSIFPNFFFNDKNFCMYQLKCLLEAADVIMEGDFTEEDVAEFVTKHEVFVATTIEKGKNGYKDKAVIDWNGFEKPIDVIDRYYELQPGIIGASPWDGIETGSETDLPLPVRG